MTGDYFQFPTSSNSLPSNVLGYPTDPGNNATYRYIYDTTIGAPYYRTEVGAHENSDSSYGTFDQGGNVWEWNEAIVDRYQMARLLRGGDFDVDGYAMAVTNRYWYYPPITRPTTSGSAFPKLSLSRRPSSPFSPGLAF